MSVLPRAGINDTQGAWDNMDQDAKKKAVMERVLGDKKLRLYLTAAILCTVLAAIAAYTIF